MKVITLKHYTACSTAGVRPLDLQLIRQIQRIAPNLLQCFDHLPVTIGSGCHPYLQAPGVVALTRAIASRPGSRMIVNSAYRTIAQQLCLYQHYKHRRCGIVACARPGLSNHNTGLAIDINDAGGWRPHLERHGFDWLGPHDPMHFDFEGVGIRDMRATSVKAFQQLWNYNHPSTNPTSKLAEDGVWGANTEKALLSVSTSGFAKVPWSHESAVTFVKFPTLRKGMISSHVQQLQQALNKHGFKIETDGVFGDNTERALKKFQLSVQLSADGVCGYQTKKALGLIA